MTIPFRPLGIITEMIEQMDLEVTYAYDDLAFISSNAFLLRMGEKGSQVHLYFNDESDVDKRDQIQEKMMSLALPRGLDIIYSGTYEMKPREDEQVDIHFHEVDTKQDTSTT